MRLQRQKTSLSVENLDLLADASGAIEKHGSLFPNRLSRQN